MAITLIFKHMFHIVNLIVWLNKSGIFIYM